MNSTENFPPSLEGSDIFQVYLSHQSVYTFNATDEADNFTVAISGGQPSNSSLVNVGSVYTFTWTLQELENRTLTFLAVDFLGAVLCFNHKYSFVPVKIMVLVLLMGF